jgi:ubiquinone/menaquinone biosynthesis C-methylase UbiE
MLKTGKYFAESDHEATRLRIKTDLELTYRQLKEAGLPLLKSGAHIADLGAGIGIIGHCMNELLSVNEIDHHLYSIDFSFNRIAQSELHRNQAEFVSNIVADVTALPLSSDVIDFSFSRFLFEYISDPCLVLQEIIRITKPGGKIVTSDLDLNCLCFYPASDSFTTKLHIIARKLFEHKLFDAYIGRKLYSLYTEAGLTDIHIRIEGYNILYGPISDKALENWLMKIRYICDGPKRFNVNYGFDIGEFENEFRTIIKDPKRFSYAPLITIEGIKRKEENSCHE